jgi:dTDP-4-dehydrorhamnose reductase
MLGQDLVPVLRTRHDLIPLSREQADITKHRDILRTIDEAAPDAVIHLAAFTAVDECERQPRTAFKVNGEGTGNVAAACRALGIPMLYVSTDYVFDGAKPGPYTEGDPPNPINVYGRSKLEGENRVKGLCSRFWVVRVSWLFGPGGRNFVRTVLGLAREGKPLRVVNDQAGAPTYTQDLSGKLLEIVERGSPGIYHVTNQGYCSRFEFAQETLRQAGLGHIPISPIATSEAGRSAPRPNNSRLANTRLQSEGLGLLPRWQDALARYLARENG